MTLSVVRFITRLAFSPQIEVKVILHLSILRLHLRENDFEGPFVLACLLT